MEKRQSRWVTEGALVPQPLSVALCFGLLGFPIVSAAEPLVTLEYRISGQRLEVTPAALAVPKGIPGSVFPVIQAGGSAELSAQLGEGAFVEAILRGPSFDARRLVGAANEPLFLPPLNLVGDYSLDNIRLIDSDTGETVLEGTPGSIPVRVFDEVLIARVTSRPLTSEEIKEKGIVIDENNFRAVEFEVGFVVDGQTVPVKFPVVTPAFYNKTEVIPREELEEALAEAERINSELSLGAELPDALTASGLNIQVKPMNIQFVDPAAEQDLQLSIPPIAGLVVIPSNIGFLNQFFSVQVFVENAAPSNSGLSVNNITAEVVLPLGEDRVPGTSFEDPGDDPLRFARVGPEAVIENILPVTMPGADGEAGTEDDVLRLQSGEVGQSEFLVEGLREGLHIVDVLLLGDLEGLVGGIVQVEGRAAGSVLVRNPNFSLAFSHPRTIRSGEPYTASVTILNTSNVPANQVSVNLSSTSISGASLESEETVLLGDILPGETKTADYGLRAQRTGSITFSNLSSDDDVVGRFRLRMGVDERGVALSPDSIGYPEFVDDLPTDLLGAADRVLGQALSVATAAQLPPGVVKVRRSCIARRVLELAEAGQRVRYGDALTRVLPDILLDWQGARKFDAGFDQIVNSTDAGREWREALADLMEQEQPALLPGERLADRAEDLAGRGETWWAVASDSTEVEPGFIGSVVDLDMSEVAQMAGYRAGDGGTIFGKPTESGFFQWQAGDAGGSATLTSYLIGSDGQGTLITWADVVLPANGKARFDPNGADPSLLDIDADCDGVFEAQIAGVSSPVSELMPVLIAAIQDTSVLAGRPRPGIRCTPGLYDNYGTIIGVLFSKPMDDAGVGNPELYVLENGNKAGSVSLQPGGRVALINLEQGIGDIFARDLTVMGVTYGVLILGTLGDDIDGLV